VLKTRENPLISPRLTIKQRISYMASLQAYLIPLQRLGMLAVLIIMLITGMIPLHAPLWQFGVFWAPWMTLNLVASALLCRGQASLWDGSYTTLLTYEIFTRAALSLLLPITTSFNVTPKDGIDEGGWRAARQLRLVLVLAGLLVAALLTRCMALAGIIHLHRLGAVALVAGLGFAAWELVMVFAALWRVTRRHQHRHHYRIPVEVAGVLNKNLVRVVDLTPGGAGVIGHHPLEVGSVVDLTIDLPLVDGDMHEVNVEFTVCSCRPADGFGWRMGGTLTPRTELDGEILIDHCHLVASRVRLLEAGRLIPGDTGTPSAGDGSDRLDRPVPLISANG
jgi:hypothetical protein